MGALWAGLVEVRSEEVVLDNIDEIDNLSHKVELEVVAVAVVVVEGVVVVVGVVSVLVVVGVVNVSVVIVGAVVVVGVVVGDEDVFVSVVAMDMAMVGEIADVVVAILLEEQSTLGE